MTNKPKKRRNPETVLTRKIVSAILTQYPDAWIVKWPGFRTKMPSGNVVGSRVGVPDLLAVIDANFFGIEVKVGYNKPSEAQQEQLRLIGRAGGTPLVARSVAQALEGIEEGLR